MAVPVECVKMPRTTADSSSNQSSAAAATAISVRRFGPRSVTAVWIFRHRIRRPNAGELTTRRMRTASELSLSMISVMSFTRKLRSAVACRSFCTATGKALTPCDFDMVAARLFAAARRASSSVMSRNERLSDVLGLIPVLDGPRGQQPEDQTANSHLGAAVSGGAD